MRLTVGISGGSGAIYAVGLLKALTQIPEIEVHLVVTDMGEYVVQHECGLSINDLQEMCHYYHDSQDLAAPISSGSFLTQGMVVVPCSMKSLSAIACGFSHNLLVRAADVTMKEGRQLILLPRETPLSQTHLENMLQLSRQGAVIMPPAPGFYNHPQGIEDLVRHMVGKILDQLQISHEFSSRWSGAHGDNERGV